MVEKKTGPVKPPIIDAKARSSTPPDAAPGDGPQTPKTSQATPAQPDPKPAAAASATPTGASPSSAGPSLKSPDPAPKPEASDAAKSPASPSAAHAPDTAPDRRGLPLVALAGAAGLGALAGLALAYGLASAGYWPTADNHAASLTALETRTASLEQSLAAQQAETLDTATRLESTASDLSGRLATLAETIPSTDGLVGQPDLDALSRQVGELSTRFEALAAGAPGDDAGAIASQLGTLSDEVSALTQRLDTVEPQVQSMESLVAEARTRLDDLDLRIADQAAFEAVSAERDRMAGLPAALDGLQAAVAAGTGFAPQLAEVEALLPTLSVPAGTRALAASGVATPAQLLARFRDAIPAVLAAQPREDGADWAQSLFDQAAAAIALRPTEGDSPQARVGQVEMALEAGELIPAQQAFASLPLPMQEAAPGFAESLAATIAARDIVAAARATDPAGRTEIDQ